MPELNPQATNPPLRLAILISGGGTTMHNLAQRISEGSLNAKISLVVASNDTAAAKGIERAHNLKLPIFVVPRKAYADTAAFSEHVFGLIRDAGAELVCLAGFLSLLEIPDDFVGRVMNIHPALLPSFGGKGMHGHHVHQAVIDYGCKVSGCTVHFCDQSYDTGPIIVQRTCPVLDDDTPDILAARVFEQECLAYPEAIQKFASGQLLVDGRQTRMVQQA